MNVKNSVYIITIAAGASLLSSVEGIAQSAVRPSNLRTTMAASGVTTIIGAAKTPNWPTSLSMIVALRVTDPSVHTSATASAIGSAVVLAAPAAKVETRMTAQGPDVAGGATTGAGKP